MPLRGVPPCRAANRDGGDADLLNRSPCRPALDASSSDRSSGVAESLAQTPGRSGWPSAVRGVVQSFEADAETPGF